MYLRELGDIKRCAGDEDLELRSEPGNVFHQTKQDVSVEGALVSLVNDHHTARTQNRMSVRKMRL